MSAVNDEVAGLGMRHVQVVLLFLCVTLKYLISLNVSVAVVAMTNAASTNPEFPEYNWSEKHISYILSSFYWGYIFTQLPGGMLCKRFGTKLIMGSSMCLLALLTALTPWSVSWGGWQIFCVIRVLQGFAQGVLYPSIFDHLAKWSPLKERNRLGGLALTGIDSGAILAMSISGIIAEGPLGWPGIFYISAFICFGWCVLWFLFAADHACVCRYISEPEKLYIEKSLAHEEDFHNKKIPIPWRAILTSVPFIAFVITRSAGLYSLSTFQTQIPSYFHGVLNMNIKTNGLLSALPFLASFIMSFFYVALADWLQRRNILSLRALRRIFNTIAYCMPASGLIAIGFLDESRKLTALILMTITVALCSCDLIGSFLNGIDLSPNHAGLLVSICMTATSAASMLSPLMMGIVVTDVTSRSQWQIIFAIAAGVYIVGNGIYLIFGSTDTQPWDAEDFLLKKELPLPLEPGTENGTSYLN